MSIEDGGGLSMWRKDEKEARGPICAMCRLPWRLGRTVEVNLIGA